MSSVENEMLRRERKFKTKVNKEKDTKVMQTSTSKYIF